MADALVAQRALEQELDEVALEIVLVLENLHELQQVLAQLAVAENIKYRPL